MRGRSCSPFGLRAPGTLNAGRGARARRARRRVLRRRAAELLVLAGLLSLRSRRAAGSCVGSGSLLVRVMREGARAAPARRVRRDMSGAVTVSDPKKFVIDSAACGRRITTVHCESSRA